MSSLADQKNTNNITGFKSKRADEIMDAVRQRSSTSTSAVQLLQELDGMVTTNTIGCSSGLRRYQRVVYLEQVRLPAGS